MSSFRFLGCVNRLGYGKTLPMDDRSFDDIPDSEDALRSEDGGRRLGPMARLVEAARGSGVGTEDPNIVGDAGPTDVPPGKDNETTILPGVVVSDEPGSEAE